MPEITVSAPGKVILHGEHAVVYGTRAIAAGLDLRTFLRVKSTTDNRVSVNLPDIALNCSWSIDELKESLAAPLCLSKDPEPASPDLIAQLKQISKLDVDSADTKSLALVAFLYLYMSITTKDGNLPPISLEVRSNLPTSAGLGSSAAYSVCLASALLLHANHISQPQFDADGVGLWSGDCLTLLNKWAFMAEKVIHGTPSGIDNSVSAYGGALTFQRGEINSLERVPKLRVLIINTKIPRSTKVLVAGVRARHDKYPNIIKPVLDSIQSITERCEHEFTTLVDQPDNSESYSILGDLISLNQGLLCVLGVSHPDLERIIAATNAFGVQSKLTGAGGGGCAFALIPSGTEDGVVASIQRQIHEMGYDCWETTVGGHGVLLHNVQHAGAYKLPF